jgi:cyanophycinase
VPTPRLALPTQSSPGAGPSHLRTLLAGFFLLAISPVGCAPNEEPAQGPLVVIGGALDAENEAIYREILDGREGSGPLCVIPTAGGNPEASMASATGRFDRWGGEGTARGILLTVEDPGRALDPIVAGEIQGCAGFFFTGGVQSRILDVFLPDGEPTPAYEALKGRFREGAVVSGSSAGAAMMSDPMIAGGSSSGALRQGISGPGEEGGVELRAGMAFLEGVPVDQHFLARGRIGRLLTAVLRQDGVTFGAGVDENTALVVQEGWGRVVGASGVVWVDGSRARIPDDPASPAVSAGLRMELLGEGDRVEIATGRVVPAEGKEDLAESPLGGGESGNDPVPGDRSENGEGPEGLFEGWTLLHLLDAMARNGGEHWSVLVDGHHIAFHAGEGFRGVAWPREGIRGTPHGLSVGPVEVTIEMAPED